jgi:hypothetical protein
MMTPAQKVVIRLTNEQRQTLQTLVRTGTHSARARTRAHILLKADADGPDAWPDERIAEALDICRMTVYELYEPVVACASSVFLLTPL